jgi:hypothetical protein
MLQAAATTIAEAVDIYCNITFIQLNIIKKILKNGPKRKKKKKKRKEKKKPVDPTAVL